MTTLTELCNDVYNVTKRPDLVEETKLAVRAATLKLHQSDFYYKDLIEESIVFSSSAYLQQFDIKSLIPKFRALKYIRRVDSGFPGDKLDVIVPENIFDAYNVERTNVCYVAGVMVNCKFKDTTQYAIISCYVNPDVTESGYSSWIADDHMFAVVFEAARVIFKQIGFDEQSSQYEKLAAEQLAEVKLSNILAVGY